MDVNTRILSLYENIGYLGMYGKDVMVTILLFFITVLIVAYSSYQAVVSELRNNWNTNKCSPIVLPFAGIIMPTPGQSTMDTTFENFNYCIHNDASSFFSIIMMPFEFVLYLTIKALDSIIASIAAFIAFIAWLKAQISAIYAELLEKVIRFIIPLVEMLVHMQDMLGKINGILLAGLYTSMNIYNLTVSGIINILTILNKLIIGIIVTLMAMVLLSFILMSTPAFIAGIALYVNATTLLTVTIVPAIILSVMMNSTLEDVFKSTGDKSPDKPKIKKRKKK